jgi:hypothetical protein
MLERYHDTAFLPWRNYKGHIDRSKQLFSQTSQKTARAVLQVHFEYLIYQNTEFRQKD